MSTGPGGWTRRPPQTAGAVERQALSLSRRASLPTFLCILTAAAAPAFLWTLPFAPLQMWFAAAAFVRLRRGEPGAAIRPLGLAGAIGAALVVESLLALDVAVVAGDVVNVAALTWAWLATDRARTKAREAWGVKEVEVLDRMAAQAHRTTPWADAAAARRRAEDELADGDRLSGIDGPGGVSG